MKRIIGGYLLILFLAFASCDTISNLPTNTSGGIFSLNGNWMLNSASDDALEGTVVTVFPAVSDATIRTLANNTKCLRERDVIWRGVKSSSGGGFTLENLVNACNNATVYRPATITIISNDEIRISGQNDAGLELNQTWRRVTSN